MQFSYLGGHVVASADIMPEITQRIRLARVCYHRFKRELYDMEDATFTLKVRMLNAELMETLLCGFVSWTPGKEHCAELRTAHHKLLLRITGFQRRQRTDNLMYAKTPKQAQCKRVDASIRKQRLLFAGGVQRTTNRRLTRRVMFGTMAGGENLGPGRQ